MAVLGSMAALDWVAVPGLVVPDSAVPDSVVAPGLAAVKAPDSAPGPARELGNRPPAASR